MAGPQAFRDQDAPSYRPGLYFCAACYALMCVLAVCWRFFVMRENRRRDRVVAEMGLSPQEWELQGRLNALKGMTDRQVCTVVRVNELLISSEHSLPVQMLRSSPRKKEIHNTRGRS